MKIKRFVAKNMREAIRQVREEQGPDAVILSNRRTADGIEVVAAVDYDAALVRQSQRRADAEGAASPVAGAADDLGTDAMPAADPGSADAALAILFDDPPRKPRSGSVVKATTAEAAASPARPAVAVAVAPPAAVVPATVPVSEFQMLKDELGGLRQTLETRLAALAWNSLRQNQPRRYAVLQALSELGIVPAVARGIADELPETAGAERARFLPLGFLARRIPVTSTDMILDGGIIALVGPTGVGKTTTLAKLAARFAEVHGTRDIALVATDHYRIGAQEQLYTYGRLLGVTVHIVTPQLPLAATLERLSDRRLVLVDTVGMSPRDPAVDGQIAELAGAHPDLKALLMLAANCQAEDQLEVARRFGAAHLSGCIISKVDETARIGGAMSVAIQRQLPIAYFTDGQRVPEDLHVARADQLVIRAMQLSRRCAAPPDDEMLALMHEASLLLPAPAAGAQAHV